MADAIKVSNLNYTYQANSPLAFTALHDVSLTIKRNAYTAIIGQTGSGKSTLLRHFNGLLAPTSGTLTINGTTVTPKTKLKKLGELRRHVGFVFQQPETQLFEETVLKDIAFAPQNFGKSPAEAKAIAVHQAQLVGLPEELWHKSPFELSGGQMRRVAIAGILALEPEILILDEPTAGLDPAGRAEMMALFARLHQAGMTIILVTHQMEDVANFADDVIVLEGGKVLAQTTPRQLFNRPEWLKEHGLAVPKATAFAARLQEHGFNFEQLPLTTAELAAALAAEVRG